jgi:phenylacetate-coenzyme A ligase PaaK-like adenylate-forming protein
MKTRKELKKAILEVSDITFNATALAVFKYQYEYNTVYKTFVDLLKINPSSVNTIEKIPFLPISFFKNFEIKTGEWQTKTIFSSSGTTGQITSQHFVRDLELYEKIAEQGFAHFYKEIKNYSVLALLPAYLERKGSSLVYMANHFIELSKQPNSGFYLYNYKELINTIKENQQEGISTLLLGVSFALWDLAEQFPMDLSDIIIMETGGMKGRRKEVTRSELHQIFNTSFQTKNIHSEYGMTELLSQGYSKGNGIFETSPTMKVLTREITDALTLQKVGKVGGINIIDLANLDSCSFLATDDLGRIYENNTFEILGRFDNSDIRGCNLMVVT